MQDPLIAELDALTARVLAALDDDAPVDATVLAFLLREYLASDRPELQNALGLALARALAQAAVETDAIARAAWLALFAEVAAIADDDRIVPAAAALVAGFRAAWPSMVRVDHTAASVEACLRAAGLFDPQELVPVAIDHLEHIIGGSYQPGVGLRGSAADQVHAAGALLTAFEITGRLPYSMLAEELMQIARREPWPETDLVGHCEAARVLFRLAALHEDAGYRGVAVIAGDADYRADAVRILATQSARAHAASIADAAAYGLALRERIPLR